MGKKQENHFLKQIIFLILSVLIISGTSAWIVQAQTGDGLDEKGGLATRFDEQEWIRVIVQLNVPDQNKVAEFMTPAIHKAQSDVISSTKSGTVRVIHEYDYIPFMAVEVDRAGFEALQQNPMVVGIEEDILMYPSLAQSVPLINADDVWAAGYTGNEQVVAVLDTGVDKNHPDLVGKVVSEACFSSTTSSTTSICPGGVSSSTSLNSALPYEGDCPIGECDHGTHVAGIVAANGTSVIGVAPDAKIIAIQVFSRVTSSSVGSWSTDQIMGLERVYDLKETYNIAAVNLSLGSVDAYSNTCDNLSSNIAYKASVDKLRSVGIVTIAASGNEYYTNGISSPACISSVVSVGATTDSDTVASYSNSAFFLDLLAPGSSIYSTIPGGLYANYNGTSMATPHVAGAWALMRSAKPGSEVDEVLNAFKDTGVLILDMRNGITKPRIDVFAALQRMLIPQAEAPVNVIASNGSFTDRVEVSWDLAEHATYYQIYRNAIDSISDATAIYDNQTTSPFNDTTAVPGTIYYYWLKGCNITNCSDYSLPDSGWIQSAELTAPTEVSASDGIYNDKVNIFWNGVGGASFYKVFRNTGNSTVGATTLTESVLSSPFDDATALNGSEYYYWVQACKNNGCSEFSLSDIGYLLDEFYIFLPLLNKNFAGNTDSILNGDFEAGRDGSWTEFSSNNFQLILDQDFLLVGPHSGRWAVWLGGDAYEISRLSQNVTISSSDPYLHFWYWIGSEDTLCGDDLFKLKINNTEFLKFDLCTSTSTGEWVERAVNLSGYAGTNVTLMFEVTNDFFLNSNLFLDDVSMSSVSTTSTTSVDVLQDLGDVTRSRTK